MAPLDLADPQTRQIVTLLALAWGVGIGLIIYNIVDDVRALLGSRKPKKAAVERRFIEPCADGLHTYEEGVCTTCKAEEPTPQ